MISFFALPQGFLDRIGMVLVAMNIPELPTLWALFSSSLVASVEYVSLQQITISFSLANVLHRATFVYEATTIFYRRVLWDDLRQL